MHTIWEAKLDGLYECQVIRTGDGTGRLRMTEISSGRELLSEDVILSVGAIFGPDVDDVANWQDMCLKALDKIVNE